MIRRLVDFALNNRWLMVGATVILFAWGAISFHNLPVEAYPDVANNYVQIITQWPGRAAEEVEQQVTIPIEIQMAGLPHMQHLRSTSLAGLSSVMLIFDDDSVDEDNRELVNQRLGQVSLPAGLQPLIGTDYSPVGQIYWYTLRSSNPNYDSMELKSLEDWKLEKEFKSVPGVVDVSSFGGMTREYQVRVDPDKLVAYGLSIGQVEQQIANNNVNAGGNFIEQGEQQINVREVGLYRDVLDIEETILKTQNGAALHVKDIATVVQGPKIRLGQIGKSCRFGATPVSESEPTARPDPCVAPVDKNGKPVVIAKEDGKLIDDGDVVEGIVLLQKGYNSDAALEGIHQKVAELNQRVLPPGVKIVPFLDRSDLLHYTTHTVLRNLTEGILLVVVILFLFLGNARGALIVALTMPFALLFAAICLDLRNTPANLLSLGALDFGMVVDGSVVMVENIVRHLGNARKSGVTPLEQIRRAAHEVQRPVFYARGIIIAAYLPIFTLQAVEGRLFKPMAWMVSFALLGGLVFSILIAPVLSAFAFEKGASEWENPVMAWLTKHYRTTAQWAIEHRNVTLGLAVLTFLLAIFLGFSGVIGSEFLPHLDEGSIWVRGTLAPSTGPTESLRVMDEARVRLNSFPEVTKVVCQTGRPDDGTDTTGFFNTEYFVDLKPKEEWRPVFHQDKDNLIAAMDAELEKMPGVGWNFSQPISDNVEEAVSGVKGELAVKIYGDDLRTLEDKANQIVSIMTPIKGVADLGLFRVIGQPNLNYTVNRDAAARYGINVTDVQDAIQTAVGGNAVTQVLQGDARYDVVVRYLPQFRSTQEAIDNIRLLAPSGERVALSQLTDVKTEDGAEEDLPRSRRALRCHQVQRTRPRPRLNRRGSHPQGQRRGQAAARLQDRLGRRIRKPEALVPPPDGGPAHHPHRHLRHPLHDVPLRQVGVAHLRYRLAGAGGRPVGATSFAHQLQRLHRSRLPRALRRLRGNRRHHARIHQPVARPRPHHRGSRHRGRRPSPSSHHDDHAGGHTRPAARRHVARHRLRLATPLRHRHRRRPHRRAGHQRLPAAHSLRLGRAAR